MRKCSGLFAVAVLLLAAACHQPTAPLAACAPTSSASQGGSPPWPATVTGCWLQHGVDTYDEFHLVQQGATVSGSFDLCGAIQGCATRYAVTGTVSYPHVILRWTAVSGQRYDETFDATVTAAGDSLVGSIAVNGQPPGPTTSFVRVVAQ